MIKNSDIERLATNLEKADDRCNAIEEARTQLLFSVALLTDSQVLHSGQALREFIMAYDHDHPKESPVYHQAAKERLLAVLEECEPLDHKLKMAMCDRDCKERAYLDAIAQRRWESIRADQVNEYMRVHPDCTFSQPAL